MDDEPNLTGGLMTPAETSAYLKTSEATLQWWRTTRRGPKYVKIGRKVFYQKKDLNQFIVNVTFDPHGHDPLLKTGG